MAKLNFTLSLTLAASITIAPMAMAKKSAKKRIASLKKVTSSYYSKNQLNNRFTSWGIDPVNAKAAGCSRTQFIYR